MACRLAGAREAGKRLALPAFALTNVAGYLGGELAYSRGVGVDHAAWEEPQAEFTPVCDLGQLEEGKPTRVQDGDVLVLLVRYGDTVRAIGATCPHAGGPLDEGTIDGERVTCPWHGSQFSLVDGSVLHGPAVAPVACFQTQVQNGSVEVRPAR